MKKTLLVVLVGAVLLIWDGCGAKKAHVGKLKAMNRLALVSVTLDRVGQGPANDPVLNRAVTHAREVYARKLAAVSGWELVTAPDTGRLDRVFSDLVSSEIASETLLKLAEQDRLPGGVDRALITQLTIASLTGNVSEMNRLKGEVIASTVEELQTDLDRQRAALVWPGGMAGIPYVLSPDPEKAAALATIRNRALEAYCTRYGLDGVIVVHQASLVGKPGDIRVIVQGNRVLSSLKLNPVLVVHGADGEVAYHSGPPRLDDLAPMKLAMPIYTGEKNARGVMENFSLDLNDPKGETIDGYRELIERTAETVTGQLAGKSDGCQVYYAFLSV